MEEGNNFPKLHNAAWPGVVGKGPECAEPFIGLDEMLDLTAAAVVDGVKFDGVDLFLSAPHVDIDVDDDSLKWLADRVSRHHLVVGSVVAPVWAGTGGGSAIGTIQERGRFLTQVEKACRIAQWLRQAGIRPYGIVRIDTACSVVDWEKDPKQVADRAADTFREACEIAKQYGERIAAEGEVCWGGLHSWSAVKYLMEQVPGLGFQADMAHTLLFILGVNCPTARLLPSSWNWDDPKVFDDAYRAMTGVLRPWTIDFHVAQNDATVKGLGTHDKTGRHCLPNDRQGKLDIVKHAGFWLRDENGQLTRACRHLCWDGCMFSSETMRNPQTWNDILAVMIAIRKAHGWREP